MEKKSYWKLKEEELFCKFWGTPCGRGYEYVARQTM
jgi:hypothetical protein